MTYTPDFLNYLIAKYTDLLPKSRSVEERAFRRETLYKLKQLK